SCTRRARSVQRCRARRTGGRTRAPRPSFSMSATSCTTRTITTCDTAALAGAPGGAPTPRGAPPFFTKKGGHDADVPNDGHANGHARPFLGSVVADIRHWSDGIPHAGRPVRHAGDPAFAHTRLWR